MGNIRCNRGASTLRLFRRLPLVDVGYAIRSFVNGQRVLLVGFEFGPRLFFNDRAPLQANAFLQALQLGRGPEIAAHCAKPARIIGKTISKPIGVAPILAFLRRLLPSYAQSAYAANPI